MDTFFSIKDLLNLHLFNFLCFVFLFRFFACFVFPPFCFVLLFCLAFSVLFALFCVFFPFLLCFVVFRFGSLSSVLGLFLVGSVIN